MPFSIFQKGDEKQNSRGGQYRQHYDCVLQNIFWSIHFHKILSDKNEKEKKQRKRYQHKRNYLHYRFEIFVGIKLNESQKPSRKQKGYADEQAKNFLVFKDYIAKETHVIFGLLFAKVGCAKFKSKFLFTVFARARRRRAAAAAELFPPGAKAFGEEVRTRRSRLRSFCEYKPTAFVGALRRMGESFSPPNAVSEKRVKNGTKICIRKTKRKNQKIFFACI